MGRHATTDGLATALATKLDETVREKGQNIRLAVFYSIVIDFKIVDIVYVALHLLQVKENKWLSWGKANRPLIVFFFNTSLADVAKLLHSLAVPKS